jgi:hypothetical protein
MRVSNVNLERKIPCRISAYSSTTDCTISLWRPSCWNLEVYRHLLCSSAGMAWTGHMGDESCWGNRSKTEVIHFMLTRKHWRITRELCVPVYQIYLRMFAFCLGVLIRNLQTFMIIVTAFVFLKTVIGKLGFEVLTAVVMKSYILWDIMTCNPLKVNWRFWGTYRVLLRGRSTSQARNQRDVSSKQSTLYSSTLKIEATCSSETSDDFQWTTRRYIPANITIRQ